MEIPIPKICATAVPRKIHIGLYSVESIIVVICDLSPNSAMKIIPAIFTICLV